MAGKPPWPSPGGLWEHQMGDFPRKQIGESNVQPADVGGFHPAGRHQPFQENLSARRSFQQKLYKLVPLKRFVCWFVIPIK